MTSELPASHGERVKLYILAAGLALWREDPASVSARAIAKCLGMTHGGVIYHFGNGAKLRDALAAVAVRIGDATIIRQLIVTHHRAVDGMPVADRQRWLTG